MLGVTLVMASSFFVTADRPGETPHVLVAAAEALVQHNLGDAASVVIRAALASPGLTRAELARLRLADAARLARANDEAGAKKQLGDALSLDPAVTFELPVSTRLEALLEDARSRLPPSSGPTPPSSSSGREKPAAALVRIVDLLGSNAQMEAADIVLQVGWQYLPFTAEEQVQLGVRRGTVKAGLFDDAEARRAFKAALRLDRAAKLPGWAPPDTVRQFDELRAELLPPPPPSSSPPIAEAERPADEEVASVRSNVITINSLSLALPALALVVDLHTLALQAGYERVLHPNVTALVYALPAVALDQYSPYGIVLAGMIRIYFSGTAPAGLYLAAGTGLAVSNVPAGLLTSPTLLPIAIGGYQHVFENGLVLGGGLGMMLAINIHGVGPIPYAEISGGFAF
ncbi:MAG TPA: hypothetical protein VFA20_14280 [Myxococcaceae bacterium]|nr:hypothetical protein [Myxococcaceae bacterium]